MATMVVEYPGEILVSLKETKDDFCKELKLSAAMKLYEIGKLSSGKAAKLAGIDRVSFLKMLGKYQISISTLKEFKEDLKIGID